jgi:hypothetical protein
MDAECLCVMASFAGGGGKEENGRGWFITEFKFSWMLRE